MSVKTAADVEKGLREIAEREGRGLDSIDAFLINMSAVLGVDTTDRSTTTAGSSSWTCA